MRIWMAVAGLAVYLVLNAFAAQPEGLFWHATLGWLQPGQAVPAADEYAIGLPPAPLYRELQQHAAG